jgi:uncharacterized protein YjbI with pentapeptide repeats
MSDEAKPDDSEPTPERQAELRAAYEANMRAGKAPYAGVAIRTRGELLWVLRERDWMGAPDTTGQGPPDLREANLSAANLSAARLGFVNVGGVNRRGADLSGANLFMANLSGADLSGTNLSGANLHHANLSGANLAGADVSGASLEDAHLVGADLRWSYMEARTDLNGAEFDCRTRVADVVWNGVPLTRVNWEDVLLLGDEYVAQQPSDISGKRKDEATRLQEYADAVLANRQVATLLRSQGLNERADRFGYRGRELQRTLLRRQRRAVPWLWQSVLGGLAGYGYKPLRTVGCYLLLLALSTLVYAWQGYIVAHICSSFCLPQELWRAVLKEPGTLGQAFVQAITALHGRGFFPQPRATGWEMSTAAFDAVAGLIIEASFVATFVQRFFAR